MWRFHITRSGRIGGGLAISIATFITVMMIAGLAALITPARRRVPSL